MQKTNGKLTLLLITFILYSCVGEDGKSIFTPNRIEPPSVEDRVSILNAEDIARFSWQNPTLVVDQLGEIEGKTIADIGAGTGYFTFPLAYLNAKVIAIDIDPQMTTFIDNFKINLPPKQRANIETRLAEPDNPKLLDGEVDKAMIINTISYISNIQRYLEVLKPAIKKNGTLLIVDFKSSSVDIASPPIDMLVSVYDLEEFLLNAGYRNIKVDETSLKYQFIVTAEVP